MLLSLMFIIILAVVIPINYKCELTKLCTYLAINYYFFDKIRTTCINDINVIMAL